MEKIYAAVQNKLNVTLEPNLFDSKKDILYKEYVTQLDATIKTYPAYKAEISDDYINQLSLLNGISKKIKLLQHEIDEKISLFQRKIEHGDVYIKKLKTVKSNLQDYTSFNLLDVTSKQMLSDSILLYNRQRVLFWIKVGFILLIVLDSYKMKKKELIISCMITFVLTLIYLLYSSYTSRG
jgi:hypothetical protein